MCISTLSRVAVCDEQWMNSSGAEVCEAAVVHCCHPLVVRAVLSRCVVPGVPPPVSLVWWPLWSWVPPVMGAVCHGCALDAVVSVIVAFSVGFLSLGFGWVLVFGGGAALLGFVVPDFPSPPDLVLLWGGVWSHCSALRSLFGGSVAARALGIWVWSDLLLLWSSCGVAVGRRRSSPVFCVSCRPLPLRGEGRALFAECRHAAALACPRVMLELVVRSGMVELRGG